MRLRKLRMITKRPQLKQTLSLTKFLKTKILIPTRLMKMRSRTREQQLVVPATMTKQLLKMLTRRLRQRIRI